jgi:hypothetical protein
MKSFNYFGIKLLQTYNFHPELKQELSLLLFTQSDKSVDNFIADLLELKTESQVFDIIDRLNERKTYNVDSVRFWQHVQRWAFKFGHPNVSEIEEASSILRCEPEEIMVIFLINIQRKAQFLKSETLLSFLCYAEFLNEYAVNSVLDIYLDRTKISKQKIYNYENKKQ